MVTCFCSIVGVHASIVSVQNQGAAAASPKGLCVGSLILNCYDSVGFILQVPVRLNAPTKNTLWILHCFVIFYYYYYYVFFYLSMQHIWFSLILCLGRPLGGQREQWVPVFLWTLRSLWIKLAHRLGSLSCLFAFRWKSLPANMGPSDVAIFMNVANWWQKCRKVHQRRLQGISQRSWRFLKNVTLSCFCCCLNMIPSRVQSGPVVRSGSKKHLTKKLPHILAKMQSSRFDWIPDYERSFSGRENYNVCCLPHC